jgi:streptogramin lyase
MKTRLRSLAGALVAAISLGFTVLPLAAQNNPPVLTVNAPLILASGGSGTITAALLSATDVESGPDQLRFTIAPGGEGGPPRNGVLRLGTTNLTVGDFFTQSDIDLGRVAYFHNGNCETYDDFTFNVSDGNGGVTPTGQYTTFTFRIQITHPNLPPVALNGGGATGLQAPFHGVLPATNADCVLQTLTFRVETPPGKGDLTLNNTNTGAFTYTPRAGEQGEDAFTFQVNDGLVDAASPGTFTITISNLPPVGDPGSGTTRENASFSAVLTGTDPDQPPQPLTFAIAINGTKGTAVITDASAGTFTYTPVPAAIGRDTLAFTVSDGTLTSAPATFTVNIRPNLDEGDLLVADRANGVVLIDPSGAQALVSSGGLLVDPRGVAVACDGTIAVMSSANGLLRLDPVDGTQSIISSSTNFSSQPLGAYGIAAEFGGTILVADGVNGVVRVNPATGVPTVLAAGGSLVLPIGLALAPSGDIYVSDAGGLVGQSSRVVRVNPVTGAQTLVSSGGDLLLPVGVAWEKSGALMVVDAPSLIGSSGNLVMRIDSTNGNQTVLSTSNLLVGPIGIAVGTNGLIYAANLLTNTIVSLDPVSGLQSVFAFGDALAYPAGITVVPNPKLNRLVSIVPTSGQIQILFQGHPSQSYALERSTNLNAWEQVALAEAGEDGLAQFVDDDPPAGGACYRVLWH